MLNGVDLILGVDWMHEHDAVLKVKHGVCTLFGALGESGKPVNLFALQPKHLPGFAAVAAMKEQWESAVETKLLSPGQAVRQLRKGCSSWLMLVKPGDAGDQEGWHRGSLAAAVAGCSEQNTKAEQDPWLVPQAVLDGLLSEYADVFGDMPPGLPPDRPVGHTIRTPPGAEAPYKRMYKLSPRVEVEVKKQVAELLAKGLIEPSSSPYGAPNLFVQKKDGSLRMCIDYRALNKLTVRDRYPLPRIDDLFDKLAGKRVFSSLDLQSGYHQIRITEEDVPNTAFLTPMGQFQFKVLCFGLTNAPATFQRMMNNVFKPLINECVLVYIDDNLVMSNTPEEHVQHLRQVLQLMRENKFYAKLAKCEFNKTQLAFLGHIVGSKGIAVDPAKVQVVKEWPTPRNLKDLQALLGLANYFRRFIPNFSSLAAPLTNLTSKQVAAAYDWEHFGGSELEAFDGLKEALCSAPVLALPDFSKPFVVCTDASLCVLPNPHRPGNISTVGREFHIVSTYMRRKTLGTIPELAVPAGAPPQQQQQLAAASTSRKREAPTANKSRAAKQDAMIVIMTLSSRAEGLIYAITTRRTAARLRESAELGSAGHLGMTKTLEQVTRWFTWPGVSENVKSYVRSWDSCQVNKSSAKKPAGLLQPRPIPERPWDSVSMDLIVKLPASGPNKYDSILVFVDRLTKMVHLVKTWESMSATQYAKLFLEHVFRLHGMPRSVVSDRGPQFHNKFWAEVTKLLQVQVNLSSAYHPETDGQTERVNRVIEEMLRHFIRPDQRDWAEYLPLVEFAINNAWQESVRSTPFYLNYGYHPRLAELLDLPQKVPQAHAFVKGMKTAVEQARQCLARAQKRMKSYQDKRRDVLFLPGDMVLLSTQNMRGKANQPGVRKLKPRYVGPFSVQYMVGKAAVKLWLLDVWSRLHNVFHVSLVKPYRMDASEAVPGLAGPPPVQWLDGEPQYTVEKVVGHRLEPSKGKRKGKCKKRRLEFLVKWQGHGDEHNTWELSTQLVGCQELLARYLTEHNLSAEAEEAADGECVQSALHVLCDDAELSSDRALALVLRKLPSRAAAAFSDGYVKHSVIQEYQARYEELDDESALDSAQCIEMFLAIVRDDLADPVLLKQQVQGMRLGDTGDSGRTEAPASLLARMSPQLVRMTEQGHLSRLGAVNMFIIALQPHPRHVLHPQGQAFVQRSKAAFARLAMPHHSEDSVELALGRAETAATQVYNELVGMLQLDQAAGKPTVAIGVNTTDLLGQLKGGDASAVKAAQRLMKQLGNALHASMPPPRPAQSQLQWAAPSTAPTHVNASSPQPAEQALFEQFRLFMASRPPAAAPLRAHTAMQPRGGPPRSRLHCDHCDKDGHTEDRCYSKHPELRPVHWGPPAPTHALVAAEGMVEDEGAAMHSFTSVPITSPEHALEAMRHALAAAADRPTSFTPGSASARSPPAAPQPERVVLADITNIVHALDQRVTGMQQSLLIVEAQVAQLRAQQPLAQGVVAAQSAQNSSASASLPPASYIRAGAPPPQALPFAANPSVHAGLSVLDRHGNPHAIPGVMIDSGSGAQLMTAGLAKQLQLEVLPTQLRIIQSGGTTFQTLGAVVVEVGLALGTPHAARSRHRVHIVEEHSSLPYTLVIGTEVMLRHGIQIDLPGRLLTYAPQLASHAHPQPRHALPLHFEPPAEWSSATMLSQCSLADPSSLMQGSPLWACVASPVISGGAEGSSGHTSACYLGVPEGKPSAASATSGCSHTPSVAEDQPGVEIRGPPLAPRSKPGRGMDRQQLPTRTPKHQPLGLGAARRRDRKQRAKAPTPLLERWSTAGKGLLDAMRKGCTLRNACAFLLILCALLPTMHACPPQQPQEVPALPCMFSCVTIAHTLPDGHQHLPPDARFTKHPKGMLFGHHPDMTAAQHHQLQAVIEVHDNAFSYSLSDLPGYHGPRPPLTIPLTTTEPVRSPPRRYSPIERQICSDKTAELLAAGIISPVEGPCSYAAAPVLPAKKDVHGNWTDKRFAIDYRQLNAATRPDIYGLPRPDELFIVQRMVRPINLDDPVVAAHDLLERSAVLSRETAAAMGNIRIAQHRDTLRYATTHSGSYKPAVRQLHPGSFVWTQRPQSNTLQLSARPEIYRVVSVGVNGVAKLQGKCGRVMAENVCNLAPCHLPDIDPTIDHTLARPTADFPCSICKSPTDAERMLLCDGCGKGFHTFCLTPKLTAVPEGSWLCAGCIGNGLTTQEVQRRTQDVAHQPQTSPLQEAFTTKQGRDRAQAAQLLHGRVARQPGTSRWGVVRFKGQQCHPHYFAVDWADGTITDKVSPTVLRNSRWLQPEGTVLPSLTLAPPVPGQRRSARLGHGENVGLAVACACPDSHGMALWA
ncbi:hypothetical protein QJQ45_018011 [Haematococcus lacustris]|nr:hypothetical protein QJQ45_018011 [Haematococcus lacustris]